MPITFTRIVRTGLSRTVSTPAIAAQWTKWVAPAASSFSRSPSRTSAWTRVKFGCSARAVPESASRCRLSTATISLPSTSERASVVAMKPAPPVIRIRLPWSTTAKPTGRACDDRPGAAGPALQNAGDGRPRQRALGSPSSCARETGRSTSWERAIRSVVSQTFTDFELIVVNDGGDPEAVDELIRRHPAPGPARVRAVHHAKPSGLLSPPNAPIRDSDVGVRRRPRRRRLVAHLRSSSSRRPAGSRRPARWA